MAIDLFEPRTMGKMLLERKGPKGLVKTLFFGGAPQTYDTEHVDFDVETRVRLMAPFSNPKLAGQVVDDVGYTTRSFTPPLVQPKKVTTAENLQQRQPGEALYGGMSPDERGAAKLGKDLGELDDRIARREEWMCVQAARLGTIAIVGPGVNATLDFGRNAGNTIALPAANLRWDGANAAIVKDLRTWSRTVVQRCGLAPDVAILGRLAADALLSDSTLRTQLDTRRMEMGIIAPIFDEVKGATYLGRLAGTGMDLWAYDEWFIDPESVITGEQPMIPDKEVVIGSTRAQTEMAYGAVPVAEGEGAAAKISLVAGARVPQSWTQKEPAGRFLKVSARPLPIPTQVNGFLRATVLS